MNEGSIHVSYIFGINKILEREELDPRVRRREAIWKTLQGTREVELTQGN